MNKKNFNDLMKTVRLKYKRFEIIKDFLTQKVNIF